MNNLLQKISFYLLFLMISYPIVSQGQTTVQIGTGTTSSSSTLYSPIYRFSATSATTDAKSNMIFTAAEMATAGISSGDLITAIGFNKTNANNFTNGITYTLRMGNSSNTAPLTGTIASDWPAILANQSVVFTSTNFNVPPAAGWFTITFSTPFIYTGGAVEISTEQTMPGGSGASGIFTWQYTTGFAGNIIGEAIGSNSNLSTYKQRPNIQLTFTPGVPCTSPPTAGTVTTSPSGPVCPNANITLNLSGNSMGLGMTYEWEESLNGTSGWTSLGPAQPLPALSIVATGTKWYRCKLACSGGTPVYSNAAQVVVAAPLNGTYTINAAAPTAGTNFSSFNAFINVINCAGISGPVTVNVAAGSGPYNETVGFVNIPGSSAINTIRINGNGAIVQFDNTTSERQLLTLDGTKHMRIDSLVFKSLNTTFGWGARITGGAAYDSITRCQFDMSSVTSTTAANVNGIIFSSSTTSATGAGINGTNVYIANNHIKGSGAAGGLNYGVGIASGGSDSNIIKNNLIENFYNNGIYIASAKFTLVEGNEIHKANKTAGIVAGEGIYTATGDMSGSKIIGNRIHSPGGTAGATSVFRGLSLLGDGTATNPVIVANNVIYKINQGGASSGIYVSTGTYNLIYHNTISFDQVLTGTAVNYGIYTTGTNTGTDIVNNMVSITAGTGGIKYGFYHATANGINDAQKNNYYLNSTQAGVQNYGYYTTAYATQAAFQTAYPALEIGSPTADPQ
ncbi:MAG: right-handed parallel beta-helix repeat-containing protein, partial [Taibaiella sp.]|nr:right-handed parallel beta-helix repeat-containing protein [Taibaiella sp.]